MGLFAVSLHSVVPIIVSLAFDDDGILGLPFLKERRLFYIDSHGRRGFVGCITKGLTELKLWRWVMPTNYAGAD